MEQDTDKSVTDADEAVGAAVAQGGAYEVIRKRLTGLGDKLSQEVGQLNESRLQEFGRSDMNVLARVRARTQNNCIARDIVQIGDNLLFGYNVYIGLKKETRIDDVFALIEVEESDSNFEIAPVPLANTFLADTRFVNDFDELYRYYKQTRLIELTVKNGKLLAGFQIGEQLSDIRVFRWSVSADGSEVTYIDNRGERDIQLPPAYDFEWQSTSRDDYVNGKFPHVNILDTIFVETVAGDLTVKIENNTDDGLGIYREPVEDETQSLDDAQVEYALIGNMILLKIRPYREEHWRYLVFNKLTQSVLRIDQIGGACVQLPEDHGIIFPGGYYLASGEFKTFDDDVSSFAFKRTIRSPNGEDILYIFYESEDGHVGLFPYNMIEKGLGNPIYCNGYALAEDGRLVVFSAESEPTRIHPMQVWETPYVSEDFASKAPQSQSFYGRIGNADLVRGISDLYGLCRLIENQSVSAQLYETLNDSSKKMFDEHFWLEEGDVSAIAELIREVSVTAELVIDDFEKVSSIRAQSDRLMREAEAEQKTLVGSIRYEDWEAAEQYVNALGSLRRQRGHWVTVKSNRYIDLERVAQLEAELLEVEANLSEQTVKFLAQDNALEPYLAKIEKLDAQVDAAETVSLLKPVIEQIEEATAGLDLLSELMSTLKVEDATVSTAIIDSISQVYAKLNQSKAAASRKRENMGSEEAVVQFGAQFKLFSQSITNALGLSVTPEKCEEQLSRLLVQLEELESQFSDYDQFLTDIMDKREEIYESFESHRQRLLDERQRRAQSVSDAADRILNTIDKRSKKFTEADELNTYFASDALVLKSADLIAQLRDLDAPVQADDIESRFKTVKEQALRSLRDKSEIFEEGGSVIALGPRHKFSVNTQDVDLTIVPKADELAFHLTGTDFYAPVEDTQLLDLRDYWSMSLESESEIVYRSEYLAYQIIQACRRSQHGLSRERLATAMVDDDALLELVREYANPRYKEGYEKGIHDHDAVLLLKVLVPAIERADLLRYDPLCRGLAQIFWANIQSMSKARRGLSANTTNGSNTASGSSPESLSHETWHERAHSAAQLHSVFASTEAMELLAKEIRDAIQTFLDQHPMPVTSMDVRRAADYLVAELGRDSVEFIGSKYALQLVEGLKSSMDDDTWRRFRSSLEKMLGWPAQRWNLSTAWFQALVTEKGLDSLTRYIPEAVAIINADERLDRRHTEADVQLQVQALLGEHTKIHNQALAFALDDYLTRMEAHMFEVLPAYQRYLHQRHELLATQRAELRLEEYKARPLSSFVRNKLINDSYLPLIGDNLAKQMGTIGESRRTDLMGLLMMISPPGYGKTTLMEYVANRLGLIFMKINCPSLGHDVLSLDPAQAPNATARQELVKLNLGLEMGNNVMLYLDDIQHTHPEFLQKFISLCDGTRRIEGVWKEQTKTYDMRGKKFCVVMAGNPYTESGESFKVPDMLANRADIYNLGDILGGMDEQFGMSYIENALTSNPVLAPLATREMDDVYKLMDMASGASIAATDLQHQYSGAEVKEIVDVLQKMFLLRDVVLKINQQYIASAAQDDKYRTEPSFKLQGSYRNMNKLTEKVSSVMNEQEMLQLIDDHYLGEAQLLTTGAEANLLKLAELRGSLDEAQAARWEQIKRDFLRNKAMGGDDADTGGKVVAQLADLVEGVQSLASVAEQAGVSDSPDPEVQSNAIREGIDRLGEVLAANTPNVQVVNQPVPGIDKILTVLADTLENAILPLVKNMDKKLEIDLRTHDKMKDISTRLRELSLENTQPGQTDGED